MTHPVAPLSMVEPEFIAFPESRLPASFWLPPEPELDPASFDPAPLPRPPAGKSPSAPPPSFLAELASESRLALPPPELQPQPSAQTVSTTERARANHRGLNHDSHVPPRFAATASNSRPRRYSARTG